MKKIFIIVVYIMFQFHNTFGQSTGNWQWAISAGGTTADYNLGVASDSAGNVYSTGYFRGATLSFGSTIITNSHNGWDEGYLVKYSSNGNCLWAKDIGGQLHDKSYCVTAEKISGGSNVVVAGNFLSSTMVLGTITLSNSTLTNNVFIAKFDGGGNVIWAASAGGSGDAAAASVVTDGNGNTYFTGYFNSPTITFGSITLTNSSANRMDVFIVKYDINGNVVWAKNGGGPGNALSSSIATDINGNIYITGTYDSTSVVFGSTTLNNVGSGNTLDMYLVKYDAGGNILWGKTMGSVGNERSNAITIDLMGNIYMTGSFSNATLQIGTTTLINTSTINSSNIFLAKFDNSNGNSIWAKSAQGSIADEGTSIGCDAIGNIYITGFFESDTTFFGQNALINTNSVNVQQDIFIAKYDAIGSEVWAIGLDAPTGGNNRISVIGNNSVYLGGAFGNGSLLFGATTLITNGNFDIFLAKLNGVTQGINELKDERGVSIFPNPANNEIAISGLMFQIGDVSVYNILGELVYFEKEKARSEKMNIADLKGGCYFLKVTDGMGNIIVKRFVKL